jgi:acyl-CoA synthetase (AMP-forming)/AMP-acid ligase II
LNYGKLNIGTFLKQTALTWPDQEGIVDGEKRFTWREFNERVNSLANALLDLRIKKGDRVSYLFYNQWQSLCCYFAIVKIGALVVPLNFRLVGREIKYQLENSGAKILIFGQDFVNLVHSIQPDLHGITHYICAGDRVPNHLLPFDSLIEKYPRSEPKFPWEVTEADAAGIHYTSGTTGLPKGAVTRHYAGIWAGIGKIISGEYFNSNARYLAALPMFHRGILENTHLGATMVGCTQVVLRQFDPEKALEMIEKEKITLAYFVPAMSIAILNVPNLKRYDLTSLKRYFTGTAPFPDEIRVRLEKELRIPPNIISNGYGITEALFNTYIRPEHMPQRINSAGKPGITVEIKILDAQDNELPPGQVGEITIKGGPVFKEYWKNPEGTAEVTWKHEGFNWYRSGDLGYKDEDGFLYITDRKKDMIKSGSENVYSVEVENIVHEHPKVAEAAVIGKPDEKWGELVTTVVVPKPGEQLTEQEIIEFCKGKLAGYKRPRLVKFMSALPRNSTGKIKKDELREMIKQGKL